MRLPVPASDRLPSILHLIALSFLLGACAKPPPPVPVPPPQASSWIHEDDLSPAKRPRIEILDLQENVSPDASTVTVTGTLINRGEAPTTRLSVQVNALDETGRVVLSAHATPGSERVDVNGAATFSTTLVNRPDVRHYHVEAIAR